MAKKNKSKPKKRPHRILVCLNCSYVPHRDDVEENGEGACPSCGMPVSEYEEVSR